MEKGRELWCEDFCLSKIIGIKPLNPREPHGYYDFCRLVSSCCGRRLTYQEDSANAFSAIAQILEKLLSTTVYHGSPVACFDHVISGRLGSQGRIPGFPSWLWHGWSGGNDLHHRDCVDERVSLVRHTWIEWHYYSPRDMKFMPLRYLMNGSKCQPKTMAEAYFWYFKHVAKQVSATRVEEYDITTRSPLDAMSRHLPAPLPVTPAPPPLRMLRPGILGFFTMTAILQIVPAPDDVWIGWGMKTAAYLIIDRNDDPVGVLDVQSKNNPDLCGPRKKFALTCETLVEDHKERGLSYEENHPPLIKWLPDFEQYVNCPSASALQSTESSQGLD
jgi:hypothetical protein